jgi:N-acetylglucosaminyl-diphospho-decaprenol L-rhamnosyltransferase
MQPPPDVSVVMVGMNTRDFVRNAIVSVRDSRWGTFTHEIIYVDNNSKDDTVEMVRAEFPDVKVIANRENRHFCPAANQGSRGATGRMLLHLNNDTLVEPDALCQMASFLDATPAAGIVGCRLLNPDGTDQWSARRFPSWHNSVFGRRSLVARLFPDCTPLRRYLFKDELAGDRPFEVDWTGTPCMLVRTDTFWRSGGFPEDFYYWHEGTFCNRTRNSGYGTWIVPTARVTHFEGKGGGARPYFVRRWHIIDFSRGAYRFYCERHNLSPFSPVRWFAAAGLWTRAALLLAALWFRARVEKKA